MALEHAARWHKGSAREEAKLHNYVISGSKRKAGVCTIQYTSISSSILLERSANRKLERYL